jgi:hypothetical protein
MDDVQIRGYANGASTPPDEFVTVIEKAEPSNDEPTVILNDEKIITKEEMQKIDANSIESVRVIKAKKLEHKKLGVINGSVIIITLKK